MSSGLRKAEIAAAALLTLVVVWLHYISAVARGPLWRDEANTVGLVTLPSLGDVWNNMQYDSFPMLWLVIVRGFSSVSGALNDPAFRAFGFFVGVGVVGVLWFYAHTFRHSFPLVSLALLAMTPSLILWGDSLRAYGLGILLILLTGALLWRFVEQPTAAHFAAAALSAIASVQTLFYNSVLLLAFCVGAVAVCALHRAWRKAALIVLIGVFAAISMAPYLGPIRDASSWTPLVQMREYSFLWFWAMLDDTLRPGGAWALVIWAEVFVLSLVAGGRALRFRGQLGHTDRQREVALFSCVTLLVGTVGLFFFLRILAYGTEPWYYLPLLALVGVCSDAISGALIHSDRARVARLIGAVVLAVATVIPATRAVRTRLTNIDLIAYRLHAIAKPRDLVLVNPWYRAVSFSRYYRGPADWMTLPPVSFHRFHRYDLVREKMMLADQTMAIRPVTDRVGETLRSGHKVFVVGNLEAPTAGERPEVLPPAPREKMNLDGLNEYQKQWSRFVGGYVQQHAANVTVVPLKKPERVSRYENMSLLVAEGWRP